MEGSKPCRARPAGKPVSKLREETGHLDQAGVGGEKEKEQEEDGGGEDTETGWKAPTPMDATRKQSHLWASHV